MLSGRLISQITAKNGMISIVHPENASKQWFVCYSQKKENDKDDNQSPVNSRDILARQFDCCLREWFLKVLPDTLQTSVYICSLSVGGISTLPYPKNKNKQI